MVEELRRDESTRSIPIIVLTAKQLTEEDKKQLNGSVAATFQRGALGGPELVEWLTQLVGDLTDPGTVNIVAAMSNNYKGRGFSPPRVASLRPVQMVPL